MPGSWKKKKKISRKTQTDQLNPKIFFLGNSTLVFSLSSFGKIEDIQLWSFPKSCAFNTTHSLFWCQKIVEDLAYLPKETPLWHLLNRVPLLPPPSRGLMGKHVQRQLICMTRLCTMRVFFSQKFHVVQRKSNFLIKMTNFRVSSTFNHSICSFCNEFHRKNLLYLEGKWPIIKNCILL